MLAELHLNQCVLSSGTHLAFVGPILGQLGHIGGGWVGLLCALSSVLWIGMLDADVLLRAMSYRFVLANDVLDGFAAAGGLGAAGYAEGPVGGLIG